MTMVTVVDVEPPLLFAHTVNVVDDMVPFGIPIIVPFELSK